MQDDTKRLILLSGVLVLLILLFLWLLGYHSKDDQERIASVQILNIPISSIRSIAVKGSEGPYGIISLQGNLVLAPNDDNLDYSLEKMQGFVYSLTKLEGIREVNPENTLSYGLHTPAAQITIITESGNRNFVLGDKNELGYYLWDKNKDRVYIVSPTVGSLITTKKFDFLDISLLPDISAEKMHTLESVSIWNASIPERAFTVTQKDASNMVPVYQITAPIVNTIQYSQFFSDIILPLSHMQKSAKLMGRNLEISNSPRYIITLCIEGEEYQLHITQHGETYYIEKVGEAYGWSIPFEGISFLETDYMDIIGSGVYYRSMDTITSIELYQAGERIACIEPSLTGESGEFLDVYTALSNIPAIREENVTDVLAPYYIIRVTTNQGDIDILECFPVNEFEYYLRVNGVINFVVPLRQIEKIFESVAH